MDKKFLQEKGLLEEAKRFNKILEYIDGGSYGLEEVDANADGLDDATGMADPMAGAAGGNMPAADPNAAMGAAPMPGADPNATMGAAPAPGADPNAAAQGGAPGFNPPTEETDAPATTEDSFDEATPEGTDQPQEGGDEEVIDVDELVDGQKHNEEAIEKLTQKFEDFMDKFQEFQGEVKANAEFMTKLGDEFEKRNPTSVERLTMRSLQSKPFGETPEEYMANEAPENYSPEDDNDGVGEPRYTITRDDVRRATDYSDIAKTLRDNGNATLRSLLGL